MQKMNLFLLAFTLISTPLFGQLTLDQGLIAHYPFSGNADDVSGNGYHATVNGATLTEDQLGIPNSAYLFDGINDFLEVADVSELRLNNTDFTISCWVKENQRNTSFGSMLFAKRDGCGQQGWHMSILGDAGSQPGKVHYVVSGCSDPDMHSAEQVPLGAWHHITLTYTHADQVTKCYLDGQWSSTGVLPSPAAGITADLFIGKDGWGNDLHFNGILDDMRIYNRALPTQEVFELFSTTPASTNDLLTGTQISIHPNPAKNVIQLSISSETNHLFSIQIMDINGRLVKTIDNLDWENHLVDVTNLSAGVYLAKICLLYTSPSPRD